MTAAENVHHPAWKDEEISHIKADVKTHECRRSGQYPRVIPARSIQDMRAELKNVA